jgi:uncharacterized protein (TIGR00297 family)
VTVAARTARPSTHAEGARQWVHVGSVGFALLLRWLTWPQAAALACTAFLFNLIVLPRIGGRRLYRPEDARRGYPLGILLYPIAVLTLILIFRTRLDVAAAAWAILAFGDGMATLVGRRVEGRRLPWNAEKSIAGTAAFALAGSAGAIALALWTRPSIDPPPPFWFAVAAPMAAAIVAAFVESIPVRLDDNISVPVAAGVVLWLGTLVTADAWTVSRAAVAAALPWAIGVNVLVSCAGYRAKTVSRSGAIGGAAIGIAIYAGAGLGGWLMLFATFLVASITSRIGLERKSRLGIAEERGGRRGAGNAVANCGVAAIAALAAAATAHQPAALLAMTAALTAGGSDTVASEIGKAWGRSTFLVTTLGRVPPGTPGAMSVEGTAAGLLAAAALGALGVALGLVPWTAVVPIAIGATAGALVESALGATVERRGILNNDMLNFINTAVAAVVALAIA